MRGGFSIQYAMFSEREQYGFSKRDDDIVPVLYYIVLCVYEVTRSEDTIDSDSQQNVMLAKRKCLKIFSF